LLLLVYLDTDFLNPYHLQGWFMFMHGAIPQPVLGTDGFDFPQNLYGGFFVHIPDPGASGKMSSKFFR
jgi:hypothetical protein